MIKIGDSLEVSLFYKGEVSRIIRGSVVFIFEASVTPDSEMVSKYWGNEYGHFGVPKSAYRVQKFERIVVESCGHYFVVPYTTAFRGEIRVIKEGECE